MLELSFDRHYSNSPILDVLARKDDVSNLPVLVDSFHCRNRYIFVAIFSTLFINGIIVNAILQRF